MNSNSTDRGASKGRSALDARAAGVEYGVLDDLVGYAIRRAQIRIYEDFLESAGPWSLTPPRFSAMTLVHNNAEMKLTDLAAAMGIARSGAVEVVNSLEKLGYVRRAESKTDKRAFSLSLTLKGTRALHDITAAIKEHDARISARLSSQEQLELIRLLDLLA